MVEQIENGTRVVLRKLHTGTYRLTLTKEHFGQIRKERDGWHAEVRMAETGDLKRFAGIWSTRRDAVEELCAIGSGL